MAPGTLWRRKLNFWWNEVCDYFDAAPTSRRGNFRQDLNQSVTTCGSLEQIVPEIFPSYEPGHQGIAKIRGAPSSVLTNDSYPIKGQGTPYVFPYAAASRFQIPNKRLLNCFVELIYSQALGIIYTWSMVRPYVDPSEDPANIDTWEGLSLCLNRNL